MGKEGARSGRARRHRRDRPRARWIRRTAASAGEEGNRRELGEWGWPVRAQEVTADGRASRKAGSGRDEDGVSSAIDSGEERGREGHGTERRGERGGRKKACRPERVGRGQIQGERMEGVRWVGVGVSDLVFVVAFICWRC